MTLGKHFLVVVLAITFLTGCTRPHFHITREVGLLPPRIEDESDFYDDAKDRCQKYTPQRKTSEDGCIQYWETVLWAQDYRSYVRARAILNRDVIYLGGLIALASVGALAGFSTLGHTGSDAYKIIPIAGTFLGGFLAYSKNEVLYDAYEVAGMKIDQTLRLAKDTVKNAVSGSYNYADATAMIRREVGATIDELTQKRIDIVKFQSKSEKDQFNETQLAIYERELGSVSLQDVAPNKDVDPSSIKAILNEAPDPKKFPPSDFRLKLTDVSSSSIDTLRISSVDGKTLIADIPPDLLDHGVRKFWVEIQARNGNYTLRGVKELTLHFSKIRFEVEVAGEGLVKYKNSDGQNILCSKNVPCPTQKVKTDQETELQADNVPTGKSAHWSHSSCNAAPSPTCKVKPKPPVDTRVTVEFK